MGRLHRFRIVDSWHRKGVSPLGWRCIRLSKRERISATDIASEFIELDGIPGLLFVVGEIGEQLALDSDQWEDDFLLSLAGDICGPEKVGAALRNAAETDKRVGAYLSAVEENRALRARDKSPDPSGLTYREMCPFIGADGGFLWRRGQTASDSDLKLAAAAFVEETDHKRMLTYLRLFAKGSTLSTLAICSGSWRCPTALFHATLCVCSQTLRMRGFGGSRSIS